MRSSYDVLRSLTYYVSLGLPDEWSVYEALEEGNQERPFAVITETPAIRSGEDIRVPQITKSFNVMAYPVIEVGEPLKGRMEASKTESALFDLFAVGADEGRQLLVPLYDFDDTPVDEMSDQRRSVDYARVMDLSVTTEQSGDDEDRFTVLVEVRLRWRRNALVPSRSKMVTGTVQPEIDAH